MLLSSLLFTPHPFPCFFSILFPPFSMFLFSLLFFPHSFPCFFLLNSLLTLFHASFFSIHSSPFSMILLLFFFLHPPYFFLFYSSFLTHFHVFLLYSSFLSLSMLLSSVLIFPHPFPCFFLLYTSFLTLFYASFFSALLPSPFCTLLQDVFLSNRRVLIADSCCPCLSCIFPFTPSLSSILHVFFSSTLLSSLFCTYQRFVPSNRKSSGCWLTFLDWAVFFPSFQTFPLFYISSLFSLLFFPHLSVCFCQFFFSFNHTVYPAWYLFSVRFFSLLSWSVPFNFLFSCSLTSCPELLYPLLITRLWSVNQLLYNEYLNFPLYFLFHWC